ncbi:MAG: response regulator [Anaerostipes sp.]|jgi:two-component system sensor histidine kinase/response regulator|nr:response regulator [Anaerostipes sp.]
MQENKREKEQMKAQLEESRAAMHAAIEAADICYFEYFPDIDEAAEYNGRESFGLEERLTNYPENWFQRKITHPEDEQMLRDAFAAIKGGEEKASCKVRNIINGEYCWYHYNFTSIYNSEGIRTRVVCTAQDITQSKAMEELNQSFENLYTRTPGWIFTCKNDVHWTLIQTNPRILDMTGYTEEEFAKEKKNRISELIPEQHHKAIHELIQKAEQKEHGTSASYEIPIYHKDGKVAWLNVDLYMDQVKSKGVLYVSCTDITLQKEREEELLESNTMYQLATQNANINLWKYDIVNDTMYNTSDSKERHFGDNIIPNFYEYTSQSGKIRKDSVPVFRRIHEELKSGQESVTGEVWFQTGDGKGWWCERINYAVIMDEHHVPSKAFGIGRDITELKESEKRLQDELKFQDLIDNDKLLLKARCNITTDEIEKIKGIRILGGTATTLTGFSDGLKLMIENAYDLKSKKLIGQKFSKENIQLAMRETREISFDYLIKVPDQRPMWVNVNARVLQDPETLNVIMFVYLYDVNTEKKLTGIINKIVDVDFEVLGLIYADTDRMEQIRLSNNNDNVKIDFDKKYKDAIEEFIGTYILEEEEEEAYRAFSLSNLKKQMDFNGVYEFSFGLKRKELRRKKWAFTYFDDEKEIIIYTRADMTDLFKEQELQKETLKNALIQAEEANNAKTDFLSRMSHEIRTPMNAIIGMNTLAMQNIEKTKQVKDCLSKVGISARFLLSLINDILDMSRIESGKISVKEEKFSMEELTYSINSIFYEQTESKGIDYDCVIANFISDYYVGDVMKIQQVLVNLLGNAVKFTNPGGKVQLIIRQDRTSNGKAYMSFSVNDTGVGIDEKDIEKIFDPFEQGDSTITTPYKGTGLGLAIAKNLVTLMGGSMHVNSIEGVGTEFVANIPLGLCEEERRYQKLKLSVPLYKLRTLIVDDDILICEHTKQLVEEIGIKAEWVSSGYEAVEEVEQKWSQGTFYDVILLDWKMPDMDGIETARKIRSIVGANVTIIVMTAYEWTEIEDAAKQAGVNLLIAKPLFKDSIISAFETVFQRNEEKKISKQGRDYDFSGKKILLVEDHMLNVEVAKRLLEAKNAQVEVAENGLRAIEIFTEKGDGYYDLILMDIRMPVMDGLTAAKAIRQLRKESAKTIPIIAMSANAFDEDIDKSKAAGMNEHLSKPIEPQILYAAIHRWMNTEK